MGADLAVAGRVAVANVREPSPRVPASIAPLGISQRRDFLRVQQHGRSLKGRYLCLAWGPAPGGEAPRVGFTISRRVGNAVVRNRVRRRLRDIVGRHRALLGAAQDHVWIAFAAAAGASFADLSEDARRLLQRRASSRPRSAGV